MQVKNINLPEIDKVQKMSLSVLSGGSLKRNPTGATPSASFVPSAQYAHHSLPRTVSGYSQKFVLIPPYRMPPQPPGGSMNLYGDAQIPGAATLESSTGATANNLTLRAHSSKYPIERELVLTNEKGATKIPLMTDRGGIHLLSRPAGGSVAPDHPPKQLQAWNTQNQHQQDSLQHNSLTGAAANLPRTPARLPEDVTALAERENNKDRCEIKDSKNAVTKTYHTLKDLISSRFKKDANENTDELNNVVIQQQQQQQTQQQQSQNQIEQGEDLRSPYSALPMHMRQMQALNQSQPNIWNENKNFQQSSSINTLGQQHTQSYGAQQRAASQPQLNMPFERRGSQTLLDNTERRGSLANIDVTDSDDGGFVTRVRRPQAFYQGNVQQQPQLNAQHLQQQQLHQQQQQQQQQLHQQQQQLLQQSSSLPGYAQRNSPHPFQHSQIHHGLSLTPVGTPNSYLSTYVQQQHQHQSQQQQINGNFQQNYTSPYMHVPSPQTIQNHHAHVQQQIALANQNRQDALRASFQKSQDEHLSVPVHQQPSNHTVNKNNEGNLTNNQESDASHTQPVNSAPKVLPRADVKPKQMPSSTTSSDYDKSGNHSSNIDSGRGSAAYSSGRKGNPVDSATTSPESSDSHARVKENESEWVDIVDAELRNILEPGMQSLNIRPESTVSGSVSSITPPLPPLSPNGSSKTKQTQSKDSSKLEYGMDSYNRPGRSAAPIGPSRAGWPGSSVQKQNASRSSGKKQDLLKRHLFGLDNDQTSTTTRSLDLESLLGGPWTGGGAQSVSDSETDTQGLRHIRSQLEGLEHMYSEVLRMLGTRGPANRLNETPLRSARRRHGSLSSLPSSSVSSRPIRDRRRTEERRKVRDMKGINKRFQRLESHVVTLARSVAHLSSEMRSQHLVMQELERLRDDLTTLRNQAIRSQNIFGPSGGKDPEPPNLTNPKRVKKLTKFFGEDPPLMRLFLKRLGYEKYASLFEAERVGMVELPYLGEERLQKLGVPLGPRLRILQEAQISLCKDTTLCIV